MAHKRKPKPETAASRQKLLQLTRSKKLKLSPEALGSGTSSNNTKSAISATNAEEDVKRLAHVAGQKIQVQTRNAQLARTANRPSVFVPLKQEDFMERFKELWEEHIEGFGSIGKKRERNEKEMNMEWRTRIKTKQEKVAKAKIAPVGGVMRKSGQIVSEQDRLLAIQKYRELQERKRNERAVKPVAA